MYNHALLMLLGTLGSLILLVLVTVSTPLIHIFYFLQTSADGGVKFGILGYCAESCSALQLGYTYGTQIKQPLSYIFVLFPVAAGLSLITAIFLIPLLCFPRTRRFPHPLFCLISFLAAAAAVAAFVVTVYVAAVAMSSFQKEGYTADLGPVIWMSLAPAAVLVLVALNAGCGTCLGGKFGRQSSYSDYAY